MKKEITEKLTGLEQTHLLRHYDELSSDDQKTLLKQIDGLDFSVLDETGAEEERGTIAPMRPEDVKTVAEIEKNRDRYFRTGAEAIKNGKVGCVLLAGGQGSRLGFNKPKGMFNIGVDRELYIFECLINNLLDVVKETGAFVPLFIMTSADNDSDTREFLAEHNYFGYDADHICFFVQEQLPTVDTEGKLMLSGKGVVSTAPNGNGGWYASMIRSGISEELEKRGIEWLNVFAVDNVLQRMADPCFIGAVIESGKQSGAKVVAKAAPEERVGVMCLEDGRPSIVEYYEMTDEMIEKRDENGVLSYNWGVILNYVFHVNRLNDIIDMRLPLHRAFKKIKHIDGNGNVVEPEEPNAYKFETLVLDMVKLQDSCLAYEVDRKREFAPVKNKEGVDSVDTARELLKYNGVII
ncbi:MAG: UDPGP type 1 family protein [Oscillospiraceae bacterium]|nr:UDPGP type 1 family protein [Oscillospiraceae bacterium]MBP1591716.1 UDPGP type 1 family protein [Oscillospiraceae bacterium]